MKFGILVFILLSLFLSSSCAFRPVTKSKGIIFDKETRLHLDIYSPKKAKEKKEVLVFIHGGNWRSGTKERYKFFGKGFARKGVVTVVIDYRLSKTTDFSGMAMDAAKAVKWVKENISDYGGDNNKIFLSGHSSGGHLAALVSTDRSYFNSLQINNPVKGVILIDAFGLNMYTYLKSSVNPEDSIYFPTFTKEPANWKKGSPLYYLEKNSPPFLLFVGGKTYPAIKIYSTEFFQALKPFQPDVKLIEIKGKKHVPMIARYYNPFSKGYKEILNFIK